MSENNLKNNFCPSPWFHMRINNAGGYEYCRWADTVATNNISTVSPVHFFQQTMQPIRRSLLNGEQLPGCHTCKSMDKHNKISGRQKQLLKIGVRLDRFEKTLGSSLWVNEFAKSTTAQLPQDWQIDLGNFCNSACIFCSPDYSSRLASEWKKIGFIDKMPATNWSDNEEQVQDLVNSLTQSPTIQYLHFIGGETLITPAFKIILQSLINAGLHKTATIGFTTNLSVWRNDVVELLTQFQSVHIGFSVESFSTINDYVRWPVCLPIVFENLERWKIVANEYSWLMQFRTTPTCLTVHKLLPIYDYALSHGIIVESCNFLHNPAVLRPSVLPLEYRQKIISDMQTWINQRTTLHSETIVNIRNPDTMQSQLVQDLSSYVHYLTNEPDESNLLPELVTWLKKIEAGRGNSILTYLPEYEELFRSAGY